MPSNLPVPDGAPLPNPPPQGGREQPQLQTQLLGAGVLGASNVATGQVAGAEVNLLAMGLNLIGQIVKQHPKFDQNRWLVPVLLAAGVLLAWALWGDYREAILRGAAAAYQSLNNYRGQLMMGLNALPPAPPTGGNNGH